MDLDETDLFGPDRVAIAIVEAIALASISSRCFLTSFSRASNAFCLLRVDYITD